MKYPDTAVLTRRLARAAWQTAIETLPAETVQQVLADEHAMIHIGGVCACPFEVLFSLHPGATAFPRQHPKWAIRALTTRLLTDRLPGELAGAIGNGVLIDDGMVALDWGKGDRLPARALFDTPGVSWVYRPFRRDMRGRPAIVSGALGRTWSHTSPSLQQFGWLLPSEVAAVAHEFEPMTVEPCTDTQAQIRAAALAGS